MNVPRLRLVGRFCVLGLGLAPLGASPDPLEPGEKAAAEWIKTRLETSRIESAWTTEKPLLEATVNGLKERAQALEDKREDLKAKTAKDREEIEGMQAKNAAAAEDLHAAETKLQGLIQKLVALRPSLPPRLSEALELPYRSLGNTGLGAGERTQLVMTVLNRCAQFNRTVTSGEEALSIVGETGLKSFDVIYWGLSRGYALDQKAGKAWYGSPGPNGWQWEPLADAAHPLARLIAIYGDRADPDFVPVPAKLGQPLADTANK
jgi:hypothetical protein